ncbi:unnamed protein product [Citrullus colocynthis]|uniref:Serpin domain-containing protein n=1 Tax=Citrullus colocynthis TaxID=252529 RepID=A0ABP0XYM2_9ROSI
MLIEKLIGNWRLLRPEICFFFSPAAAANGFRRISTCASLFQVSTPTAREVASEVNTWVRNQTKGLITDIISPVSVDSLTELLLVNALYFKGNWRNEFDASQTKREKFYLGDGSSIKTPFVSSEKKQDIAAYDGFKDGLSCLIEKVDSETGFIDRHIPQRRVEVGEFKIPKFNVSYDYEVSDMC